MTDSQLIGELKANVERLLQEAEAAKRHRKEQSERLANIEKEFHSLKMGGRILMWIIGILGSLAGFVTNWALKIWTGPVA